MVVGTEETEKRQLPPENDEEKTRLGEFFERLGNRLRPTGLGTAVSYWRHAHKDFANNFGARVPGRDEAGHKMPMRIEASEEQLGKITKSAKDNFDAITLVYCIREMSADDYSKLPPDKKSPVIPIGEITPELYKEISDQHKNIYIGLKNGQICTLNNYNLSTDIEHGSFETAMGQYDIISLLDDQRSGARGILLQDKKTKKLKEVFAGADLVGKEGEFRADMLPVYMSAAGAAIDMEAAYTFHRQNEAQYGEISTILGHSLGGYISNEIGLSKGCKAEVMAYNSPGFGFSFVNSMARFNGVSKKDIERTAMELCADGTPRFKNFVTQKNGDVYSDLGGTSPGEYSFKACKGGRSTLQGHMFGAVLEVVHDDKFTLHNRKAHYSLGPIGITAAEIFCAFTHGNSIIEFGGKYNPQLADFYDGMRGSVDAPLTAAILDGRIKLAGDITKSSAGELSPSSGSVNIQQLKLEK